MLGIGIGIGVGSNVAGSGGGAAVTTWDGANSSSAYALSGGNLTATRSAGTGLAIIVGNLSKTAGKWYFEVKGTTLAGGTTVGVIQAGNYSAVVDWVGGGSTSSSIGYNSTDGKVYVNQLFVASGLALWGVNDVIGCAVDIPNKLIYFSKNGVWQNSAVPSSGTGGIAIPSGVTTAVPGATGTDSPNTIVGSLSSGYASSPPSGFSPWA